MKSKSLPVLNIFSLLALCLSLFTTDAMCQVTGDYRSKASGNWSDFSTWQIYNGSAWVNAVAGQVPNGTSEADATNVYLEAAFTVTLTDDAACKNLNLNGAQDVVRINTSNFSLNIWGKMRTYTGVAPGTTDNTAAGSGINGWINTGSTGSLKFRGTVDRTIFEVNEVSANSRSAGWRFDFAFDQGVKGVCKTVIRCGHLIVTSGILDVMLISEGLTTDGEIRIAGDDYTAQPGNGISNGTCLIKANAVLKAYRLHKNTPTSVGNSLASFKLENGATLIAKQNCQIPSLSYDIQGLIKFESSTTQNLISTGGKVDAVAIINYMDIVLGGALAKTMVNNVSIAGKLTLEGTASLSTGSFNLSYGSNTTLEYHGSALQTTSNSEFPVANGPSHLIVNNSNGLQLHAARSISGLLTLSVGIFNLQNNHFTLGENSPAIAGTASETNMIVSSGSGELRKVFNSPGYFFFPIGETTGTTEYTYARIDVNSADLLDASTYVGIRVVDNNHPANAAATDYISRYWGLSTNMSNINYKGTFQYLLADVNGTETNINVYNYDDETSLANGTPIIRVNSSLHRIVVDNLTFPGFIAGANLCSISNNTIDYTGDTEFCGTSGLSSSITGDPAVVLSGTAVYQWQQRINTGSWNDLLTAATGQNYTESNSLPESNVYYYRRVVSDPISCLVSDIDLSNEVSITIYAGITGNQIGDNQIIGQGTNPDPFTETASLAGGNGSYTYQWQSSSNVGGPYADILLADGATYTAASGATEAVFYVRKVESGVCSSISNEINIAIVTSNQSTDFASGIKLYPNPATESIYVDLTSIADQGNAEVVIMDNQGVKLMEQNFNSSSVHRIDLSLYSSGLYYMHLTIDGEYLSTYKVSKR